MFGSQFELNAQTFIKINVRDGINMS